MHRHFHFCGICLQLVLGVRFQIVDGQYLQAVVGTVNGCLDICAELLPEGGDVAAEEKKVEILLFNKDYCHASMQYVP